MIDLLSIWLIVWLIKTAAEDVTYAWRGKPNPRYELKKQKALAAGKQAPAQPRYGSRDWVADLVSDGLVAQTEKRRAKAAKKAKAAAEQAEREERPLDDLAEAVREEPQRPAPARADVEEFPEFESSVVHDEPAGQPVSVDRGRAACQHCGAEVVAGHLHPRTIDGQRKQVCAHCAGLIEIDADELVPVPDGQPVAGPGLFVLSGDGQTARSAPASLVACRRCGNRHLAKVMARIDGDWACPDCAEWFARMFATKLAEQRAPDGPDAQIIPFPNPKITVKEISMATSEVSGLATAIAFAQAAADAHNSFAAAGSEGYVGALQRMEMSGEYVSTAQEAQEASNIAAAKWAAHAEKLREQVTGQEFYRSNPDAGNKQALVNE